MVFEVVQNFKHTRTAFDGLVEVKNEMRRVFQDDVPGQFRLQRPSHGGLAVEAIYRATTAAVAKELATGKRIRGRKPQPPTASR